MLADHITSVTSHLEDRIGGDYNRWCRVRFAVRTAALEARGFQRESLKAKGCPMKTVHAQILRSGWRANVSSGALLLAACGPVPDTSSDIGSAVQSFGKVEQKLSASSGVKGDDAGGGVAQSNPQDEPVVPCAECACAECDDIEVRLDGDSIVVVTGAMFRLDEVCVRMLAPDPIDERLLETVSPALPPQAISIDAGIRLTTFARPPMDQHAHLASALLWGRAADFEPRLYDAYFDGTVTRRLGDVDE